MNIQNWDNELRALAGEIEIMSQAVHRQIGERDPTAYERLERAADDGQFTAMVADLRQSVDNIVGLPPRLAALFHWLGVSAGKILQYYESQSRLLAKIMWMKLVQGRLSGDQQNSFFISDQEVVEMAIRKTNLRRTKDFLQAHLKKLEREKSDLHRRYVALDTKKSNYWAAMSMRMQFGKSWRESTANPILRSIDQFVSRLTLPFRISNSARIKADSTREMADARTSELIRDFRDMALNNAIPSESGLAQSATTKLKQGREELRRLESLIMQTEQDLSASSAPQARVKLVKNATIPRRNAL